MILRPCGNFEIFNIWAELWFSVKSFTTFFVTSLNQLGMGRSAWEKTISWVWLGSTSVLSSWWLGYNQIPLPFANFIEVLCQWFEVEYLYVSNLKTTNAYLEPTRFRYCLINRWKQNNAMKTSSKYTPVVRGNNMNSLGSGIKNFFIWTKKMMLLICTERAPPILVVP